jgi:endonuclease G
MVSPVRGRHRSKQQISVLSGPVFGADDPTLLETLIPQAFWKIVCRVQDGKLRATGFLASQSQLLTMALARAEAFTGWPDLGRAAVYQKAIAELETLTGLSFGSMRRADTLALAGGNAPERLTAPIASLADICW